MLAHCPGLACPSWDMTTAIYVRYLCLSFPHMAELRGCGKDLRPMHTQSLLTRVLELAGCVSGRVATSCRRLFWEELLGSFSVLVM